MKDRNIKVVSHATSVHSPSDTSYLAPWVILYWTNDAEWGTKKRGGYVGPDDGAGSKAESNKYAETHFGWEGNGFYKCHVCSVGDFFFCLKVMLKAAAEEK